MTSNASPEGREGKKVGYLARCSWTRELALSLSFRLLAVRAGIPVNVVAGGFINIRAPVRLHLLRLAGPRLH